MKIFNFLILFITILSLSFSMASCNSSGNQMTANTEILSLSMSGNDSTPKVNSSTKQSNDMHSTATTSTGKTDNTITDNNEMGKDYYVSQTKGKGRKGTMEQPAKDLAAIAARLEAGDRVHIAAGFYTSKTDRGTDIINVPISIYGGYSDDFQSRDPWGESQSILAGKNDYQTSETTERLGIFTEKKFRGWEGTITIDGIIVDNGPRNRYKTSKRQLLLRKASPIAQEAATPGHAGIKVRVGAKTNVEITNCIVMNTASSQGAIEVQLGTSGKCTIQNNLVVNNTGEGIYCKTNSHSATDMPEFNVQNNTILFNWTNDAIASSGGSSLMVDAYCKVTAQNNVFGFGDQGGVNNVKKCKDLTLKNNLFFGHGMFDYREFRSDMPLAELEDYAEFLNPDSESNFSKTVELPVNEDWAKLYFGRKKVSRAEVDAAVKVSSSDVNELRSMLGLNLRGSDVNIDADIWLHQMDVASVIQLGVNTYEGAGCQRN